MFVRNSNVKAGMIVGFMCALFVSVTLFTPLFKVNHVILNVNPFVTDKEIIDMADLQIGKSLMLLTSEGLTTKKIIKHPYVKSVKVKKKFPDTIELSIDYRKDYLAIFDSGFYIILDETLQVLRVDKLYYDATLVNGFTFHEFQIGKKIVVEHPKSLKDSAALLALMKKSHVGFVNKMVYDGKTIQVFTKQGLLGKFSSGNNLESNFNHFMDIYDNLASKGINKGLIDVSNNGLPTFKPFD